MKKSFLMAIAGFLALFILYHSAEYMIIFKNSAAGFLGFQFVFFAAAWRIAKWQFGEGLSAWGLGAGQHFLKHLVAGMLVGILLYGLTFSICLFTGIEKITHIPSGTELAGPLCLFIFGCFFSSFSEDILTRGYIFRHLGKRVSSIQLVIISAAIYLLNHIYRLSEGFETCLYLFSLGVLFIIPVILTKKLWFTGGMHWAGNSFFYLTHELIKTGNGKGPLTANYILVFCIILLIPFSYFLLKKLKLIDPAG